MSAPLSSLDSDPLCRLIYRSDTSWDLLSNEALLQLCMGSAERNRDRGITGLLLLSGECFLQVLEGPSSKVNSLYLEISKDERHTNLQLLSFEQVNQQYFENWAMHVIDLHELSLEKRSILTSKYALEDGYIEVPTDERIAFALLLDAKAICLSESERSQVG